MPFLLQGSAQDIFTAFKREFLISPRDGLTQQAAKKQILLDIPRTPVFGPSGDLNYFSNQWANEEESEHFLYAQGNMSAENLKLLLGDYPFKKFDEEPDNYCHRLSFAFVDQAKNLKGFTLLFRKDNPGQWMMGMFSNANKYPGENQAYILSSETLNPLVDDPELIQTAPASNAMALFISALNHPLLEDFVHKTLTPSGQIDPLCARIQLLCSQPSQSESEIASFDGFFHDPSQAMKIIFTPNPILDRLFACGIKLSAQTLQAIFDESSEVFKHLSFCVDQKKSKSYLALAIALHESGTYFDNKVLLQDKAFCAKFKSIPGTYYPDVLRCLKDEKQLSFLKGLMQSKSVNSLFAHWVEMDLKLTEQLEYIQELAWDAPHGKLIINTLYRLYFEHPLLSIDELQTINTLLRSSDAWIQVLKTDDELIKILKLFKTDHLLENLKTLLKHIDSLLEHAPVRDQILIQDLLKISIEDARPEIHDLFSLCHDLEKVKVLNVLRHLDLGELRGGLMKSKHFSKAIIYLYQLDLTEHLPEILRNPEKCIQLLDILMLPSDDLQRLGLIFLAEGHLQAEECALLAKLEETQGASQCLICLYHSKGCTVDQLKTLALDARAFKQHQLSMTFAREIKQFAINPRDISLLSSEDVDFYEQAFRVMLALEIKDKTCFNFIIKHRQAGKALCYVLPLIKGMEENDKQFFMKLLLAYSRAPHHTARFQSQLQAISDPLRSQNAFNLLLCLQGIHILQALDFSDEALALVAENSSRGSRFRHIIAKVQKECIPLEKRLNAAENGEVKAKTFAALSKTYRKELLQAGFDSLTGKDDHAALKKKLAAAQQKVDAVVHIDRHPELRKAMMVLSNFLTIICTLGMANAVNKYKTGHFFFNSQPKSAETIEKLNVDIYSMAAPSA